MGSERQPSTASSRNTARIYDRLGTAVPDLVLADHAATRLAVCFQCRDFGPAVATAFGMILMIWSSDRAQDYAVSIEHAVQEPVHVVASLHQACERLRSDEFSAVIVDQWVTEAEPEPTSVLFDHLGPAVPLFVNFGISGVERILRELRAALSRRGREIVLARHVARQSLRDELKDDVTALLLSCDVALQESNGVAAERLARIKELASHLKNKLAVSDQFAVAGNQ